MELSENVRHMKLLHELKGAFPNMADEIIQQCIKQVGFELLSIVFRPVLSPFLVLNLATKAAR